MRRGEAVSSQYELGSSVARGELSQHALCNWGGEGGADGRERERGGEERQLAPRASLGQACKVLSPLAALDQKGAGAYLSFECPLLHMAIIGPA